MSVNKFADTVGKLQQMKPWEVPQNPDVENHIVTLYNTVHGEGGEAFYERESRYLNRAIVDDKNKWNVTSLSVFLAFVDLAVKDLTLEPGAQALCYLLNRNTKLVAGDGKEYWENRAYISVTGYGEILLRQRCGQIRHCDNPTVVYEGDEFGYKEQNGRKHVTYGLNMAHNSLNPVACFMKITRIDGSVDYAIMLPEAWMRLGEYSKKNSGKKQQANDLYTANAGAIDPGFLIAKCVKHAFKNYPKLPIGKGMVMEADLPEEERVPDYYTMPTSDEPKSEPESFAAPEERPEGVIVDPVSQDDGSDDGAW